MSRSTDFVVLVAENEAKTLSNYTAGLDRLPNVVSLPASGKDEAIAAIDRHYIDAAVIDIQLDKDLPTGLDVLDDLADRSSNASVVIASQVIGRNRQRLMGLVNREAPRILEIIDKTDTDPGLVIDAIAEAVAAWEQTTLSVTGGDLLEELLWTPARRKRIGLRADRAELTRELDRVYRDLFGRIRGVEGDRSVRVVFEKLQREGLSPAVTALAAVTLGEDRGGRIVQGNLCVVKIGPRDEIREEAERYERFVKFGVRLAQRVEMLSTSFHDCLGGICYSFAGGVFGSSLKTIDEILRSEQDTALAEAAFRRLFDPANNNWYGVVCSERSPRNYMQSTQRTSFDRCYEVLHGSLREAAAKAPATTLTFEAATDDADGYLRFHDRRLDIPRKGFLGSEAIYIERPACLVHGDMHGGNVMVELDRPGHVGAGSEQTLKRVCLIDYRNAGPAPRPLDVLALQASVRLADAHAIANGTGPSPTGDELVAVLRSAAQRVHAERKILEETWSEEAPRKQVDPSRPAWERTTRTLTELLRANFEDMPCEEYLASAIPCALRQCSFKIGVVARVRMLAWLSALYGHLNATTE